MWRDLRSDWTARHDVRAKVRSSIKRLLVRFGYPPDKQPDAIKLVMEQTECITPPFGRHGPKSPRRFCTILDMLHGKMGCAEDAT
jgi:hypothetical protein